MPKKTTSKLSLLLNAEGVTLFEEAVSGRDLCPFMRGYVENLAINQHGTRKINIPSTHSEVAAIVIFQSRLKEEGLHISDEIHVVWRDRVIIERWPCWVGGESTCNCSSHHLVELEKVRIQGEYIVEVELTLPGSEKGVLTRTFDFSQHDFNDDNGRKVVLETERSPFA